MKEHVRELCERFFLAYSYLGVPESIEPVGNGYINDTYRVITGGGEYLLQRINKFVFKDPERLMDNIVRVTGHIREIAKNSGEDADRATLTVLLTDDGRACYQSSDGEFYRVYKFINNACVRESVGSLEDMYTYAHAFGRFIDRLSGFRAEELFETIPDFHNTKKRYEALESSFENDIYGRAFLCAPEMEFARSMRGLASVLSEGGLPLRVTHNDTKLSNILFDTKSKNAVAVIDLDTVMAGYSVYDFGDIIRCAAASVGEESVEFSRVELDLELYRAAALGFVHGCTGLSRAEIEMMPYAAMTMTYECGIRFLCDYLCGDVYFKTQRAGHNLDRAKNQFALLSDMEKKLGEMKSITYCLK